MITKFIHYSTALFMIVILSSIIFGSFTYWMSLKSINNNSIIAFYDVMKSHTLILKEFKEKETKIRTSLHKLNNLSQYDYAKLLEIEQSLIGLEEGILNKQLDTENKFTSIISTNIERAAKLNIERSTVSFLFIICTSFLISMFLVIYLNATDKFQKFIQMESDSQHRWEKLEEKFELINKNLSQIQSNTKYIKLHKIQYLNFMTPNEVYDTVTNLLAHQFYLAEWKFAYKHVIIFHKLINSKVSAKQYDNYKDILETLIKLLREKIIKEKKVGKLIAAIH